jgi:chromosome segregation ATPase
MADVLTVGLPTLAVLIGILVNNSRLTDLRAYIASQFDAERRTNDANFGRMEERFRRLEDRIGALEARMGKLEARVDSLEKVLLGKIEEIDNRLSRLEDRFGH